MPDVPVNEFIAVDCETTGLDPKSSELIEIAFIKFKDSAPSDRIVHLLNPGEPIPLRNKRLTGIDDEMVRDAPKFEDVAEELLEFIGDGPLVGHNIGFDLKFLNLKLRNAGFKSLRCPAFDTLRIAALLFPEEPSLKLSALTRKFGIGSEERHRAEGDAEVAGELLIKLQELILELPLELLELLTGLGRSDDAGIFSFLNTLCESKGGKCETRSNYILGDHLHNSAEPVAFPPGEVEIPDDLTAATGNWFTEGGLMSEILEGFQERPGQPEMAASFAEHLEHGGFNAIEAGCGIGKSPAYLAPAVMATAKGRRPIVISTYTKNLQDQLATHEIPALSKLHPNGLKFSTLKGRGNYICLSRLVDPSGRIYGTDRLSPFERALLLSWVHNSHEGEIDRLNYFILNNFNNLKSHMNFIRAEGEFCEPDDCQWEKQCFVRTSRKRAAASDIIITNHSLFFAGFEPEGTGSRILPELKDVIFDEAHHLEQSFGQAISLNLDSYIATRLLKRFADQIARPQFDKLDDEIRQTITEGLGRLGNCIAELSTVAEQVIRKLRSNTQNSYAARIILTPEIIECEEWNEFCTGTTSFLHCIEQGTNLIQGIVDESGDSAMGTRLLGFLELLKQFEDTVKSTINPDFTKNAIWLDNPPTGKGSRIRINVWPLSVADRFRELTKNLHSCQFTSATLSTAGNARFFTDRLGLNRDEVSFSTYPAPFDFRSQARIFIPEDLEPPVAPDMRMWRGMRTSYINSTGEALKKIILRFGGHTMCLFTSTQDLDDVGEYIKPALEENGINCLLQFKDGGKNALIDEFSTDPRTALLGTRSFFEGVDITGNALKCLVIARLPFPHPEEPLHFSKLRHMSEEGEDGFANLTLPMANLTIRQMSGRLIRTSDDVGVILFLDNRLISKGYGEQLLDGLDSIPKEVGPLEEIIEKAAAFTGL